MKNESKDLIVEINHQNLLSKRKALADEEARQNQAVQAVSELCDYLYRGWLKMTDLMTQHATYQKDKEDALNQRKHHIEKVFVIVMLTILFVAEMIIGAEIAMVLANNMCTVIGIQPGNTFMYIVVLVSIPAVILAFLLLAKTCSKTNSINKSQNELDEQYQDGRCEEDAYLKTSKKLQRKKHLRIFPKLVYIFAIIAYYAITLESVKTWERQTQVGDIQMPSMGEIMEMENISDILTQTSEAGNDSELPYSSMLGVLMMIVIIGHILLVFWKQPRWGKELPLGKFNAVKNMRKIEDLEAMLLDRIGGLLDVLADPKNKVILDRMMIRVSEPVKDLGNRLLCEEVFHVENENAAPALPYVEGYTGIINTYEGNLDIR